MGEEDIVERLRDTSPLEPRHELYEKCIEAADEIERLRGTPAERNSQKTDGGIPKPETDIEKAVEIAKKYQLT